MLNVVHPKLGTIVLGRARPLDLYDNQSNDTNEVLKDSPRKLALTEADSVISSTVILDEEQIGRGRIGRVYRVDIQDFKDSSHYSSLPDTRMVVKLVIPQGRTLAGHKLYPRGHDGEGILADLAKEALIYSLMNGIQGEVIPRCYGYYRNDVAGCLLLEDCGEALKFPYRRLDLGERRILFELQKKLHQAGVSHRDVARRNFVKGPGGIRLLDFDKAVQHQCIGFEEPRFLETGVTLETDNDCPELRKWFKAFGLLPMEYYSPREREAYKAWDGEPWWSP